MEWIITTIGLILLWGTSLITIWIKWNIKLKELEIKIEHISMRQDQQCDKIEKIFDVTSKKIDESNTKLEHRLDKVEDINRLDHISLGEKLDEMKSILLNNR